MNGSADPANVVARFGSVIASRRGADLAVSLPRTSRFRRMWAVLLAAAVTFAVLSTGAGGSSLWALYAQSLVVTGSYLLLVRAVISYARTRWVKSTLVVRPGALDFRSGRAQFEIDGELWSERVGAVGVARRRGWAGVYLLGETGAVRVAEFSDDKEAERFAAFLRETSDVSHVERAGAFYDWLKGCSAEPEPLWSRASVLGAWLLFSMLTFVAALWSGAFWLFVAVITLGFGVITVVLYGNPEGPFGAYFSARRKESMIAAGKSR